MARTCTSAEKRDISRKCDKGPKYMLCDRMETCIAGMLSDAASVISSKSAKFGGTMNLIQIHLIQCRVSQDLLLQITYESEMQMALISGPYSNSQNNAWVANSTGEAAL